MHVPECGQVYAHLCVSVSVNICVHACECEYVCMHECERVCAHLGVSVNMCVHVRECELVRTRVTQACAITGDGKTCSDGLRISEGHVGSGQGLGEVSQDFARRKKQVDN